MRASVPSSSSFSTAAAAGKAFYKPKSSLLIKNANALRLLHSSTPRLEIQTVNVPSMGDSISEGTLVEVKKVIGDSVHADEVVFVLETDKVKLSFFVCCGFISDWN